MFETYRLHVATSMIKRKFTNFVESIPRMRKLIETLIASFVKGIEIDSVFTLLKITSIAVGNLIPSSGRVHVIYN